MRCIFSSSFIVILYFVVTNTQCAEKLGGSNKSHGIGLFSLRKNLSSLFRTKNYPLDDKIELKLDNDSQNGEERARMCLKNVTKCLQEDFTHHPTSEKLFKLASTSQPPFDLSRVPGVSRSCQIDSEKYLDDLRQFKLWALKVYDSSAKLPSGLLNGNVNQLGDFDMCLSAQSDDGPVKGQYCLASLEVQIPNSPYLAGLHKLIQSHYHFKSKLEDPGHRVPKFSSINWALCVPHSCTPDDVAKGLKTSIQKLIEGTELKIRSEVDPAMCRISNNSELPWSTIAAITIFSSLILFEVFATLYDNFAIEPQSKWITSFSLTKNINSLVAIPKQSTGDIRAVHGIRMINAILLVLAHKSMAVHFMPYFNRTEAVEYFGKPISLLGRAASLYTDPFIMISGLLTSYSLIGKLDKTGKINIFQEYVSRLYRIVPTFAALIAFCTFILPWLSDGPMWNLVVTHHSDICKKYWWRNMLFIHNYFGFKDMCLTHTHHLGIDTELFFISPFMIYGLWKWPLKGSICLTLLAVLSTIARYYVTYEMQLSNFVHFGTSVEQLFDTADKMYILPPHRVTVYIMGLFTGYILRKHSNVVLTKAQIRVGNAVALFSCLVAYLGPAFMSNIDYVYNPRDAAWYAAFSPILWVAAFCWVVYTTQLGYGGWLGYLYSHPICTLWTKISYTVYLTQFPVFFYNVGVTRSTQEFSLFTNMLNLQEYSWILGLSVLLTVLIEMPFQNLRNLMLKRTVIKGEKSSFEEKKVS